MTTYLFFDTETTGLIDFKKELSDPSQPRITQLAALLTDEHGNELERLCEYVQPDGWEVPPEITALNGTTTEMLWKRGLPMPTVLGYFNSLKDRCTHRVGHNVSFDKQMLAREAFAYGLPHDSSGKESLCTMKMAKGIVSLPASQKMNEAGMRGSKPPKLQEAYTYFFGTPFDKAHDAMADVIACKEVFFAIKKWQADAAA